MEEDNAHATKGIGRTPYVDISRVFYPEVHSDLKPKEGMSFQSLDHAWEFYQNYAKEGGFTVRKWSEYVRGGVIYGKHFVCSKQGQKPADKIDERKYDTVDDFFADIRSNKHRKRSSIRCGCPSKLVLKKVGNEPQYVVLKFTEEHNHVLVSKADMQFMSSQRQLSHIQENMLFELANLNLGPVKSFHIFRTKYGGFENIGATATECKNWMRDLKGYIGEYDAEVIVRRHLDKQEFCEDYSFHYDVDEWGVLTKIFWADQDCKRNYMVFGDVVSFDATFNTNKYKMVFVPFTGIDNHFRNVTLGAGLLSSETTESYKWLLEKFVLSFGKAPRVVVTDQDPAMKQAIQQVLPGSRHRLCMWHIMKKLADKVGPVLCSNEDFKKEICNIVWTDQITPEFFEHEWCNLIQKYNLSNNDWLNDMYQLRSSWIPAYYRHEPMSGLMRTTSRSESENHFFRKAKNSKLTLLEFFNHFDTALEVQRYNHRKNDYASKHTFPDLWTDHQIELQASRIFTRFIFLDQQEEIYDAQHSLIPFNTINSDDFITVEVKDLKAFGNGLIKVNFNKADYAANCECRRFEQYGLICKHIFYMLLLCKVENFPDRYILKRWRQDAVPPPCISSSKHKNLIKEDVQKTKDVISEIMCAGEYLVESLINDFDGLCNVRDQLKSIIEKVDENRFSRPKFNKKDRIAHILGIEKPTDAPDVRVPMSIRNKGRGSHRRIKSKKEIAISKLGKRHRECTVCHRTGHDIRTCETLKGVQGGNKEQQQSTTQKGKQKLI